MQEPTQILRMYVYPGAIYYQWQRCLMFSENSQLQPEARCFAIVKVAKESAELLDRRYFRHSTVTVV